MKLMTRRELFSEVCSKDTVKSVFRAWNDFTGEYQEGMNDNEPVSKEDRELAIKEAISKFGRLKKRALTRNRNE